MAAWVDEKCTNELRFVTYRLWVGPNPFDYRAEKKLQQLWKVAKGGEGNGVQYIDEWRDVPVLSEERVK